MKCPKCNSHNVYVMDSRPIENGTVIRRTRVCRDCYHAWHTFEVQESWIARTFRRDIVTRCKECNAELEEGTRYCPGCGKMVIWR